MTGMTMNRSVVCSATRIVILAFALASLCACSGAPRQTDSPLASSISEADDFENGANRPPTAKTLYRMARILAAQGKDGQAYGVLKSAIQRYPTFTPAYCELAQLQLRQRKIGAAINTLHEGLGQVPNDAVLLNDLGMCWMLQGNYEQALKFFTRASEAAPADARYRSNMALATGMLGQYDQALAIYQQVVKPCHAHYNLAIVCEARNDLDRANVEYAKAFALDPNLRRRER